MQRPASPRRIALLGAESTGKSHLATALAERLRSQGLSTVVVPEVLRGWCEREGRTPRAHEQAAIALEQARQVLVCDGADVVIADTTPLMTAVYSHLLFADGSLYEFSLHHQRVYDATLVTGLDLPWMADGLMRDGPQVREPVDRLLQLRALRRLLDQAHKLVRKQRVLIPLHRLHRFHIMLAARCQQLVGTFTALGEIPAGAETV